MAEQSATMDAMMAKWADFATPGESHKHLARMEGNWTGNIKIWMNPGEPPMESVGQSKFAMILGGRYLRQEVESTAMGQPFQGLGYTAFDNGRKEFIDLWMDSMGTSVMILRGTMDANGHVQYKGKMDDCMTDQRDVPMRSEAYFEGDDTHIMKMWKTGPDGAEFQTMEIVYKRA